MSVIAELEPETVLEYTKAIKEGVERQYPAIANIVVNGLKVHVLAVDSIRILTQSPLITPQTIVTRSYLSEVGHILTISTWNKSRGKYIYHCTVISGAFHVGKGFRPIFFPENIRGKDNQFYEDPEVAIIMAIRAYIAKSPITFYSPSAMLALRVSSTQAMPHFPALQPTFQRFLRAGIVLCS